MKILSLYFFIHRILSIARAFYYIRVVVSVISTVSQFFIDDLWITLHLFGVKLPQFILSVVDPKPFVFYVWFEIIVCRRYGSPHHSRSQSVKTPGSGRPTYLSLPQQRSRVASMPNTGVEEEYYRLRHFSITGKGVVNRGDSLKSRRSRSNNSVTSSNSSHR